MKLRVNQSTGTAGFPVTAPLLRIRDLRLQFGGVLALAGASFDLDRGEICGLIGPNGAGKTTLFNCVSRLYEPDSGSIEIDDVDLLNKRPDEIAGAGVARTFQNVGLVPDLTVLENVLTGSTHRTRSGLWASAFGLPRVRAEERAERQEARSVLSRLSLSPVEDSPVGGLPFGTLKRVELARAVMMRPQLLMLDEPANGLMHEEVAELAALIRDLRDSYGFAVLLVEHHMGMVMSVSDKVVVLNFGNIIASGRPDEIQANPDVIAAYLGAAA